MNKFRMFGAALMLSSGLMVGAAGIASAAEQAPVAAGDKAVSTGSAALLVDIVRALATGSAEGTKNVGESTKPSTGSSYTGSSVDTGSAKPSTGSVEFSTGSVEFGSSDSDD